MKIRKERFVSCIIIGLLLVAWVIVKDNSTISDVLLPSPKAVVYRFYELCINGYGTSRIPLFVHLKVSLGRLLVAFALSLITAIPLGLISGYNKYVSSIMNLLVEFYRPIPPLAYYTLLVLWMGITEQSKVALLFLAGFAPIFVGCYSAVKKVNEDKINASYMLGANRIQTFLYVVLPSTLPDILTSVRTAIGVEYTTLVSAEMVAAKAGIGWMVLDASNWLKSDVVFVGVIIMGITGIVLNQIIVIIEKKIVHWAGKN